MRFRRLSGEIVFDITDYVKEQVSQQNCHVIVDIRLSERLWLYGTVTIEYEVEEVIGRTYYDEGVYESYPVKIDVDVSLSDEKKDREIPCWWDDTDIMRW